MNLRFGPFVALLVGIAAGSQFFYVNVAKSGNLPTIIRQETSVETSPLLAGVPNRPSGGSFRRSFRFRCFLSSSSSFSSSSSYVKYPSSRPSYGHDVFLEVLDSEIPDGLLVDGEGFAVFVVSISQQRLVAAEETTARPKMRHEEDVVFGTPFGGRKGGWKRGNRKHAGWKGGYVGGWTSRQKEVWQKVNVKLVDGCADGRMDA